MGNGQQPRDIVSLKERLMSYALAYALAFAVIATPASAAPLPAHVAADQVRIREHLSSVEAYLRALDTSHLSAELQAERARNLDRLHDYWVAGVFPRNDVVDYPTPIFIDDGGRACAVGYLMIESGWGDAARAVSHQQNLAFVEGIESPKLGEWVAQSGLTVQEAAWIQPFYEPPDCYSECPCDVDPVCTSLGTALNECIATCVAPWSHIPTEPGCCAGTVDVSQRAPNIIAGADVCDYLDPPEFDDGVPTWEPEHILQVSVELCEGFPRVDPPPHGWRSPDEDYPYDCFDECPCDVRPVCGSEGLSWSLTFLNECFICGDPGSPPNGFAGDWTHGLGCCENPNWDLMVGADVCGLYGAPESSEGDFPWTSEHLESVNLSLCEMEPDTDPTPADPSIEMTTSGDGGCAVASQEPRSRLPGMLLLLGALLLVRRRFR